MTGRRTAWGFLAATSLSLMLMSSAHAATPVKVSCGETITADTALANDLVDCPNNGIVVGADNITVDLNGHTVDGDGVQFKPCARRDFCDVGVLNDGHDGVTVTNGSTSEFAIGVFIGKARHNRVLCMSSSRNVLFGFVVAESARSLVRDSSGDRNLAPDGDGLGLFGSHRIRVVGNSFRHNPLGIHVEDSTHNLIKRNRVSRNAGFGIFMQGNRNQVRRNTCKRNAACILVGPGNRNVIARNHASGGLEGIAVEEGRDNLVSRNVVIGARRVGIRLGIGDPPIGGSNTVVRRNLVRGIGGDGFVVFASDENGLLERNVAIGAADDGFDVRSDTAELARNRAARNGDLGIEAVLGVIDGGQNTARHNGDGRQCAFISCR
jgi:parallel beta-helix repeat protein